MKLEKYDSWKEVLSEYEFRLFVNELIEKKDKLTGTILLEIISLLSEKYVLFYRTIELTNREQNEINEILIRLTNWSDLNSIQELTGIMFNFRLDLYFYFLKANYYLTESEEVRNEVVSSLSEYEE